MPSVFHPCSWLAAGLFAASASTAAGNSPAPTSRDLLPPGQPHIVYVLADDLGYGEIGPYGQTTIRTPALDALARDGRLYTSHYSGSPVCAPARSTLMTGQHTGRTPVRNNFGTDPATGEDVRVGLTEEHTTVATLLQRAGYRTGLIGKWGLGEEGTAGVPWLQGFETFYGFLNQKAAHSHFPPAIWDGQVEVPIAENADGVRQVYIHDRFTERALDFIATATTDPRPFFLYLAYTVPHDELAVPADQPRGGDTGNDIFAAMVERLDRDVGRLREHLQTLGLDRSTVFIFTSDNGPHNQEGKRTADFQGSGPFRGIKRDVYEGGIRVPFIAAWPGVIPAGTTSDHPSAFWDFLPTACDLAGVPVAVDIDGISHLPDLLGLPNRQHAFLYWEFQHKQRDRRAVRAGDWKLVIQGRPEPQLYHLPSDPGETRDLAATQPRLVEHLRTLLEASHQPHPLFPLVQP